MPVLTGDILLHVSSIAGSTGGSMSGSTVTSGVANNVFADISDEERQAGGEMYRKVFWKNHNNSSPLIEPVVFTPTLPDSAVISIGLGVDKSDDSEPLQGNMTALTATSLIELVSDGTDTRVASIWGVNGSGDPVEDQVTLNGTTPVLSAVTFSKVWAVEMEAIDALRVVEIRQGASGPVRGSIPVNELISFLWIVEPDDKASGMVMPDLGAGQSYGVWMRLAWPPDADPVRPNSVTLRIEES